MSRQFKVRNQYPLISGILLCALLLRAMIPVGFMPAPGRPFSLQICRSEVFTFSGQVKHSSGQSHFDSCPFGSAPGAGPAPAVRALPDAGHGVTYPAVTPPPFIPTTRADRSHRARGPPAIA